MDHQTALGRLRADHKVVLQRLESLLADLERLSDPREPRTAEVFRETLDFISHEVWFHFKREEEALFPAIARVFPAENAPVAGGPVYVLTEEHGVLRKLVGRFGGEVEAWENGTSSSPDAIRLAGTQMVRAFQKHIYKEDNIVFRLTEQMLSADELSAIDSAFAAVIAP